MFDYKRSLYSKPMDATTKEYAVAKSEVKIFENYNYFACVSNFE